MPMRLKDGTPANRRPLAALSTMLVILSVCVVLAAIVGPGRAIDWVGTYLTPVRILGLMVGVIGLLVWEGRKASDDGKGYIRFYWHF